MTASSYDVAIVGLGAMGSATAYNLSKRGSRVVAFDRFAPPHSLGSSHGETRIIREAYYEHPLYVPLVRRAYDLWDELARAARRPLLKKTGGVMIGPEKGELVSGAKASASQHMIPHRVFSAEGVRLHFPAFDPLDEWVGVVEPRAGVLFAELCVHMFIELATKQGAAVHVNDPVLSWRAEAGGGVSVRTAHGTYHADRLVLAAGPWMRDMVPDLVLPLAVERQIFYWFEPHASPAMFDPNRCPITLWEYSPGKIFAAIPDFGQGVKVMIHHQGELTTAENVRRTVSSEEDAVMFDLLRRFIPRAKGRKLATRVCLYTNTPDSHFLIDAHPLYPQVIIASPCSGHGFKFASVIGEILADVATGAAPRFDLAPFGLRRFVQNQMRTPTGAA
jgi:sarcosine oxidase